MPIRIIKASVTYTVRIAALEA